MERWITNGEMDYEWRDGQLGRSCWGYHNLNNDADFHVPPVNIHAFAKAQKHELVLAVEVMFKY
jgi:hypothetical protein